MSLVLVVPSYGQSVSCSKVPADAPQYASLLQPYGSARPIFDVPGVDYYVGAPSAVTLKDPTLAGVLPTCAAYDAKNHLVRIAAGSNCTLDSYDLTKGGGLSIYIPGGVVSTTIVNSRFGMTGNSVANWIDHRSGALVVTNSTFAGGGGRAIGSSAKSATSDIEYNLFTGLDEHGIEFNGSGTFTLKHNAFVDYGMRKGSPAPHPDPWLIMAGSSYVSPTASYNLMYLSGAPSQGGAIGINATQIASAPIYTNYTISHNVVIDTAGTNATYMLYTSLAGSDLHITDNYLDASGSFGPVYPATSGAPTCTGNIALTSGTEWDAVHGDQPYTAGQVIAGTWGAITCQ